MFISGMLSTMISIVVPFRNAKKTLKNLLASLLNQDFPKTDYEIILVDDGSSDGSLETIEDLVTASTVRIKIVKLLEGKGCFHARNKGIDVSEGEIIAFIDSDEIADENWLKFLTRPFSGSADIRGVTGRVLASTNDCVILPYISAPTTACEVAEDGVVKAGSGNVAYRKDTLLKLGGFDPDFDPRFRGDSDLCLRTLESSFKIVYESQAVVYHPLRKMRLREVLRAAFLRHRDVLLYSKHRKYLRLVRSHVGTGITKPIVGPISALAILVLTFGFSSICVALTQSPIFLLCSILGLFGLWLAFFTGYGYKLVSSGTKPGKLLRLKAAVTLPLYFLTVFLGRFYGCVKYRTILL